MVLTATQQAESVDATAVDDAKVAELAKRSPEQFVRLYDRHVAQIYRYLLSQTCSIPRAERLTSATFQVAQRYLESYQAQRSFRVWLFRIARRLLAKEARPRGRIIRGDVAGNGASQVSFPEPGEFAQLAALSTDKADAVALRTVVGLPGHEVAAIMGQPESTVRMLVFLGIQELHSLETRKLQEVM